MNKRTLKAVLALLLDASKTHFFQNLIKEHILYFGLSRGGN